MEQQEIYQNIISNLRSTLGLLDLEPDSQLKKDVISICDYFENPTYRIAVFGPFNHGKSTLLNALLGKKTLPIDLIPTTGAAIYLRYGETLHSKIIFKDGTEKSEDGTKILKTYAILDEQSRMRDDIAAVEVYCCHPFLKNGVEFLDLPGTNDREDRDNLVKDKLLTADLIVQVLDARKLMTLGEREQLINWLLDRGIRTIVFVVNFVNLLETQDQKQVYHRLRFIAESFRAELPAGISNLYRVDALPALRSRLKGDISAAQTTGLTAFEAALQSIVSAQKEDTNIRFDRVKAVINKLEEIGEIKKQKIAAEFEIEVEKERQKIEIQKRAETLIKQGLQKSISEFESWLYLPKLLSLYQREIATALQQDAFEFWQLETLQPQIAKYQQEIDEWVNKGCEFFDHHHPGKLSIQFSDSPLVSFPEEELNNNDARDTDFTSVAIPAGLGFVLGGVVGAAVLGGASYLLNKAVNNTNETAITPETSEEFDRAYHEAARVYLTSFSQLALVAVDRYHKQILSTVTAKTPKFAVQQSQAHHKLRLLENLLSNLNQNLELLFLN